MNSSAHFKKLLPCLLFLVTIVLCQYFVLITHQQVSTYLKNKLSGFTIPLVEEDKHNLSGPLHVLIISYARTGSSFLGDLLQSHPGSFYHFEPLHFLSGSVINSSNPEGRQLLHKLFLCQVSQLPGFLSWQRSHKNFMKLKRNVRFWKSCSPLNSCYNATYIDGYCSRHDIVIVKTIRMDLRGASRLFKEYPDLNLKIIYLARDPRGTLNSRWHYPVNAWCRKDPQCYYSKQFCTVLEDDAQVACDLLSSRPNDFLILRYEDLSREPFTAAQHLCKLMGIEKSKEIDSFLSSHTATTLTTKKVDGVDFPYTTFRNSVITSMKWRQEMSFVRAVRISNDCRNVLQWLGYHKYTTSGALKSNVNFDKSLDKSVTSYCER